MLPIIKKATNVFLLAIKATYMTTKTNSLLSQIKSRRKALGLKQSDMMLRVGMSRQQFQRLEAQGNPRLNTLELIALGLNCELMLIPKDKSQAVRRALDSSQPDGASQVEGLNEDPWRGLLGDD